MSTQNSESSVTDRDFCGEHVRQHDRDRYLCAMFTPEPARDQLMALYAFNTELALVHERVNEAILGEMRFQWWRDQIASAYERSIRPEGYAGALHEFIVQYDPPQAYFDSLIDARVRDLSKDLFDDIAELEGYCLGTTTPLIHLSSHPVVGSTKPGFLPENLVNNMGIAGALVGLIRAIPAHGVQGRCMIPASVMRDHGVTQETVFMDRMRPKLTAITEHLINAAEHRLISAQDQARALDKTVFPCLLPMTLCQYYLSTLRKVGYDPFHPRVQTPNSAGRALRLLYATWRKRV